MSQALAKAKALDWKGWRLGIMRSLIQGGAHAVLGGITISVYDPKDFGVANITHTVYFALFLFAFGGFMRLMFFLNDHPVADVQVTQTPIDGPDAD